jgi:fucose 4-O-acetylase-like acetyltransferase
MERPRHHAVDFVKAAAIVAVAFTHAGRGPWEPGYSHWDYWLCAVWVNFQVPAFLAVSGFLYHRRAPIDGAEVRARLVRLLVPYLVASAAAYALGVAHAASAGDLLFQLATGSAVGIYYFIFLLALFIPTTWALSRLGAARVGMLCVALWLIAVGTELYAHWRIIDPTRPPSLTGFFWLMRSPFNYTYATFVTGWVVAEHLPAVTAWARGRRAAVAAAGLAGVALYALVAGVLPQMTVGGLRMLYTASVVTVVALATAGRPAPALVRFLSNASLGLYLYHHLAQRWFAPAVAAWPPALRITATALGGLAAAALVCRLGARVLGQRARLWLGA